MQKTPLSKPVIMRFIFPLALASLVACADFPDFDARIAASSRDASYPTLQPLDPLIARAADQVTTGQITPTSVTAFDNRITALRSKAARLRGTIVDAATRARMRRGVAVPAAIR